MVGIMASVESSRLVAAKREHVATQRSIFADEVKVVFGFAEEGGEVGRRPESDQRPRHILMVKFGLVLEHDPQGKRIGRLVKGTDGEGAEGALDFDSPKRIEGL